MHFSIRNSKHKLCTVHTVPSMRALTDFLSSTSLSFHKARTDFCDDCRAAVECWDMIRAMCDVYIKYIFYLQHTIGCRSQRYFLGLLRAAQVSSAFGRLDRNVGRNTGGRSRSDNFWFSSGEPGAAKTNSNGDFVRRAADCAECPLRSCLDEQDRSNNSNNTKSGRNNIVARFTSIQN